MFICSQYCLLSISFLVFFSHYLALILKHELYTLWQPVIPISGSGAPSPGPTCPGWYHCWILTGLPMSTGFLSFKFFYFVLEYSQLTMLWEFQVDSKGTQPYIYSRGCFWALSLRPETLTVHRGLRASRPSLVRVYTPGLGLNFWENVVCTE